MCGRYTIGTTDPSAFDVRFGGAVDIGALGRYNVAPTEPVPVVLGPAARASQAAEVERTTVNASWGLLPPWARSRRERLKPINARAEELASKKLFAPLLEDPAQRVLVLADGWYEWLRAEDPKMRTPTRPDRVPFHHTVDGGAPVAFAGLLRTVRVDAAEPGPAGFEALEPSVRAGEPRDGRVALRTVTVVTCAANRVAARLHDRMPAVLGGPEEEAAWLDPAVSGADALGLLVPLADERLTIAPASPLVNKVDPAHDGPHLLDPQVTEAPGAAVQQRLDLPGSGGG
ncbi:SOS response-associated peptidase [Patulibacter defluvii]|uniref:SOS response-associated peptidase n=1 Tax=Patulibacter defluvii TaxID=3095358 RepID=UPI002A74A2E6|nr:SOS response-associated peptidase [Patulibacter sp. DM4]